MFLLAMGAACSKKSGVQISGISPKRGPFLGGDPVTITGSGFSSTQGFSVYFGTNKAKNPIVRGDSEIVVSPPAGKENETVDVEIEFDDAHRMKIPKAYTYYDPTKTTPQ
jgi:hypothetical protein